MHQATRVKWERLGTARRAGILAPIFSVYSKNNPGKTELSDLKLLVDWASVCGLSIVQLLPMNEMGPLSCPYDAISSFAIEGRYLGLTQEDFSRRKKEIRDKEYLLFKEANIYWLDDFCLYKALKEYNHGKPWYEWGEGFKSRNVEALERFRIDAAEGLEFQSWLQWQAFKALREIRRYANSRKVLLKGDLPILVSRDSADVWAHPGFFRLEYAAGAPPDMYAAMGQRWGMPTYNWENIEKDGFRYLKEKLKFAQNFYDILRIDHVVGLFRIWSIPYNEPLENKGLNGFFDPRDESLWRGHGRKILSAINESTGMFICAEDLGVIPKACTETLEEFQIPGNDVQRWVKDWKVEHDFLPPDKYRQCSVAMLSTHDTTNWAAWWENEAGTVDEALFIRRCNERGVNFPMIRERLFDPVRSRHGRLRWRAEIDSTEKLLMILGKPRQEATDFIDFYENTYLEKERLWKKLGLKGTMREECDEEILEAAFKVTLGSRSKFCIETIIDWLYLGGLFEGDAYQYRINTPGTISDKNWSIKIPLPLGELMRNPVCAKIRKLVRQAGRR